MVSDFPSLLSPLGEYRKAHVTPSKGKKRKRNSKSLSDDVARPLPPAVGPHVLVGLNSVTRHLESLAAVNAPSTVPVKESSMKELEYPTPGADANHQPEISPPPLSLVVVTHPQPSLSSPHAHIPTLLHLATLRLSAKTQPSDFTRLVTLPTSKDNQFSSALHIPRVGAIGIFEGAPGAKALEDYVRKHVGLTECAWVEEALKPDWRGLNVQQD